jgi:hypothetical protein
VLAVLLVLVGDILFDLQGTTKVICLMWWP